MDPSALIFVALAVAWAVYLVPKALEHHDESLRNRTVSTFSHTMRVLARREPVGRSARLVAGAPVAPSAPSSSSSPAVAPAVAPTAASPAAVARRPKGARSAAARRRNVLALILLANVAVVAAAALGRLGWVWVAAPAVVLVAWLVACRLMVRRERATRRPVARPAASREYAAPAADADQTPAEVSEAPARLDVLDDDTTDIPVVAAGSWEPVEVPLPTYVSKPPAVRRTVRTIDLDSTGVWSSGRSESDSALAREADAARRSARDEDAQRRATGS